MWLGQKKGYFQDWITQLWVKATGRRVDSETHSWLLGPVGNTDKINDSFLDTLCTKENLTIRKNEPDFGLMDSVSAWQLSEQEMQLLNKQVIDFYEHTINYNFEVWSSWCGFFYPFGKLLNLIFSKRLQQLNLPLKPLDSSRGIQSNIIKLFPQGSTDPQWTIWYRILKSKNDVIYAGLYDTTFLQSLNKKCLKVIFPLPNGNATVVMHINVLNDGSLFLESRGKQFGHPGFYFTLTNHKGKFWAKYVKVMHETIRVYEDDEKVLRADHFLKIWGMHFLKLHYKMTQKHLPS
jgi:hypothetical protein